jgi:hypothetical protein
MQYYMQIGWKGLANISPLTQNKLQPSFLLPVEEAFDFRLLTRTFFI